LAKVGDGTGPRGNGGESEKREKRRSITDHRRRSQQMCGEMAELRIGEELGEEEGLRGKDVRASGVNR
jgi:hypothetical protein